MKKGICIALVLISLVVISSVMAYQSTITVKTGLPGKDIIFKAADQISGKTLPEGEFRQRADEAGIVVFEYNLEQVLIKMGFTAMGQGGPASFLNNKPAIFFPDVILDEFVDIDLNKQEPTISIYHSNKTTEQPKGAETNTTDTNKTTETNITSTEIKNDSETVSTTQLPEVKQTSSLTGAFIGKGKIILSSGITYYIFGGILVLIGGFVLIRTRLIKKTPETIRITKLSDIRNNQKADIMTDERFAEAERKLNEAKQELDEIKDRRIKLKEAKEKLQKDKEEFKRLGGQEENEDYLGLGSP